MWQNSSEGVTGTYELFVQNQVYTAAIMTINND